MTKRAAFETRTRDLRFTNALPTATSSQSCHVDKPGAGLVRKAPYSSAFQQALREEIDAGLRQVAEDDARELERIRLDLPWYAEVPCHPCRGSLDRVEGEP